MVSPEIAPALIAHIPQFWPPHSSEAMPLLLVGAIAPPSCRACPFKSWPIQGSGKPAAVNAPTRQASYRSYLLALVDARGSSAGLAYAQLIGGSLGQPPAIVQPAKTFPPLLPPALPPAVPLPAVPLPLPALPPDDEPADGDVPPDDAPADGDVPPNDEPANDDAPADGDVPPNDEPANDDAPADGDAPPNDEPADVEPDDEIGDEPADGEEPPDELESSPELAVLQATTTGVTASATAQAIDEIRMIGNPRCLGGAGARRQRCVIGT